MVPFQISFGVKSMYPMVVLYWFTYTHKYHTLIQHFFLMKESNGTKYALWGMLLWWSPLMMINGFQFQNKISECFVWNSLILLYQNIFQIYFCMTDAKQYFHEYIEGDYFIMFYFMFKYNIEVYYDVM